MPRGSNGAYTQPGGTAAVSGQTISSTAFNTLESDIGNEITNSLDRQGRGSMQAALAMSGFRVTGAGDPVGAQDLATMNYVTTAFASFTPSSATVKAWLGYTPANVAGDTFTGQVNIVPAVGAGLLVLAKSATNGMQMGIRAQTQANSRWSIILGDSSNEAGGNAGSDFAINSFADGGAGLANPIFIQRSTGLVTFNTGAAVSNGLSVSGTFTGTTQGVGDNSTNVATTAFVYANVGPATAGLAVNALGAYVAGLYGAAGNAGSTYAGASITVAGTSGGSNIASLPGTWLNCGNTWSTQSLFRRVA